MGERELRAVSGFRDSVIPHPAHAAKQAARPEGVPVVVERTANTISCRQMDRSIATECRREEHTIVGRTEPEAIVGTELTGNTTQHREGWRCARCGDHL